MSLMRGGTLADRLQRRVISVQEVVWILERLAPALDMAHARGIVHRDLKPGNILFDQQGNPYIADFGIAKLLAQTTQGLSQTGMLIGTPAYMSPEQARGLREIDGRSDIYSVGVILFQMLSRECPYDADTPLGLAYQHVNDPIPDIRTIKPDLPPGYQAVIKRAMAKDREERYQTAGQMVSALKAVAESREPKRVAPPPAPTPPPRRAPWWQQWPVLAGGAASLIIITIVVTLAMTSEQGPLAMLATATPTNTPTSTNTPTNTPVPPTSTPTLTSTPLPPTATPTPAAAVVVERGDDYYEKEQYDQAIAEYSEAIRLDPTNSEAYSGRGRAYFKKSGFNDQVFTDCNEAIRLDPTNAVAYNYRGNAYLSQKDYDKAIADYNEAIRLDPDWAFPYNNRGLASYNQDNYKQAITDYSEAIRIDPDYAYAYYGRGVAYRKLGNYKKAIADYNEAIRIDPDYAATYVGRGWAYHRSWLFSFDFARDSYYNQ